MTVAKSFVVSRHTVNLDPQNSPSAANDSFTQLIRQLITFISHEFLLLVLHLLPLFLNVVSLSRESTLSIFSQMGSYDRDVDADNRLECQPDNSGNVECQSQPKKDERDPLKREAF